VKENLHVVLGFSPLGDAFSRRLRMFPSLINCCTIDWFQAWPTDALESVAQEFMEETPGVPEKYILPAVELCGYYHKSTTDLAHEFQESLSRIYYVTPTSYLEMIATFQELLGRQSKKVKDQLFRYENGLEKLQTTSEAVSLMQQKLTDLQPILLKIK
jgi:dynein heavy chain